MMIQEVAATVHQSAKIRVVGVDSVLGQPLLQGNERLAYPVSGRYQGEDKRTVIRRGIVDQMGAFQCSLVFQFKEEKDGWSMDEASSFGSMRVVEEEGVTEEGDAATIKTTMRTTDTFVVPRGFVSPESCECNWVENDKDQNLERVVTGLFNLETNSFVGEWQSSDGKQGTRELALVST